jgi:hypothetical protein
MSTATDIEFEDPPKASRGHRTSRYERFVQAAHDNPGKSVVVTREAKSPVSQTHRFPGTRWVNRNNGDGTFTVYVTSATAPEAPVKAAPAAKASAKKAPAKKASAKPAVRKGLRRAS